MLKMHSMADVMKAMGSGNKRGPMAGFARMLGMGGGMPSPEEMQKLAQQMPGGLPSLPGAPGAPGLPPTMRFARPGAEAARWPAASRAGRQAAGPSRLSRTGEEEVRNATP